MLIYAGGNDLGITKSVDLVRSMKEDVSLLNHSGAPLIFNGQRCVWRWGEGHKMNKARKFINSIMAQYINETAVSNSGLV